MKKVNWERIYTVAMTFIVGVGALVLIVIGVNTFSHGEEKAKPVNKIYTTFGANDDRIALKEPDLDWEADGFKPIDIKLKPELQRFTYNMCEAYNLDYSLILAQMFTESSYQPDLISKTHDYGLMQINRCNHKWLHDKLGVSNFLDPYQNIRAGTYIMRKLFERNRTTHLVLMSYNMGETSANELYAQGVTSSIYSQTIVKKQKQIRNQLSKAGVVWNTY